jgi:hypothetical protein
MSTFLEQIFPFVESTPGGPSPVLCPPPSKIYTLVPAPKLPPIPHLPAPLSFLLDQILSKAKLGPYQPAAPS